MRYLLTLLLVSAGLITACDSAPPTAPQGSTLIISANPLQIGLSGESTITIQGFRPTGSPLAGTLLSITTDRGTIQPLLDFIAGGISLFELDNNGRVQVRLVADGRAGQANVTAATTTTGGGGGGGGDGAAAPTGGVGGASVSITVEIGAADSDRPSLVISANPSVIPVTGESTISLLGRQSDNTPVPAGRRIRLTADLGDLGCAGAPNGGCSEVFTDNNGEAEVTFIAGTRGGSGLVSAILGTSAEATVTITVRDAVTTLFLSVNKQSVDRQDPGDTVILTALLQDAQGEPVGGTTVVFQTDRGVLSDNTVPSNNQGEAMTTLTVTDDDVSDIPMNGTFSVSASATSEGNMVMDSVTITVLGAP